MTLRTILFCLFCFCLFCFCLLCCMRTFASADLAAGELALNKGDYAAALKEFLPLAKQGNPKAQRHLGWMYDTGHGVPQDYQEAAKWFRLAADQGNSDEQSKLGVMYDDGKGVAQDYVQAHMWLNLAASRDAKYARNRDSLAQKMTPAQIAEAQRLAREWKPTNPSKKRDKRTNPKHSTLRYLLSKVQGLVRIVSEPAEPAVQPQAPVPAPGCAPRSGASMTLNSVVPN